MLKLLPKPPAGIADAPGPIPADLVDVDYIAELAAEAGEITAADFNPYTNDTHHDLGAYLCQHVRPLVAAYRARHGGQR